MTDTDDATRQATAALAHRVRERDAQEPAEREDADLFAGRFLVDLRGHGWRPTNAQRTPPPPPRAIGDPAEHADELARVRLACAEATLRLKEAT